MVEARKRPLKQLCDCHRQDFRLVWWHPRCRHNDHLWVCGGCDKMWLEWLPDMTMTSLTRKRQKHEALDEHGRKWVINEWDTSWLWFTTDDSDRLRDDEEMAILPRD